MFTRLSGPINVQWELTSWCNHNCIHCYNYWRSEEIGSPVFEVNDSIFCLVEKEVVENNVFSITLTGGEPLLVIPRISNILKRMRSRGITFNLNSNITLLTPKMIYLLGELGIKSVLTSLMSADPQINDKISQRKGSYKIIVKKIRFAVQNGLGVSVNMVVTKDNFHTIEETGKLAKELGAKTFCATKASAPSNCLDFSEFSIDQAQLTEMFGVLLRIRDKYDINVDSLEHYPTCVFPNNDARATFGFRSCTAAKTSCSIGFNGEIRPCSHASMEYGNIADGLKNAWNNMHAWRDDSLIPILCKDKCSAFPFFCGGGCRIEAYTHNRGLGGKDPSCLGCINRNFHVIKNKTKNKGNTLYRVSDEVRFRPESFGAIAFFNQRNWLSIDHRMYKILMESRNVGSNIDPSVISKEYGVIIKEAEETISRLVSSKILVPLQP
ncbi:MAG: radical SAM protein [bacterium]|nr:radical SAM protein [bacterium]